MLLGITGWPDCADHQLARMRRSSSGRITAITNWPHCGDHRVASLRRSLNGSIAPIINSHGKVSPRMRLKSLPAVSGGVKMM
jgi:hypothetical protein